MKFKVRSGFRVRPGSHFPASEPERFLGFQLLNRLTRRFFDARRVLSVSGGSDWD